MNKFALILACGTAVGAPLLAQGTTSPSNGPQIGTFGFDTAGMDRTVAPGQDFFGYANGAWAKATAIPADRSSYGMFVVLDDLSTKRSNDILVAAAARPGSRIGDLYASFMDEARIDAAGIAPLKATLAAIKALNDKSTISAKLAELARIGVDTPFGFTVDQDDRAPQSYIAQGSQGGLGLPDRDYYLKNDAALARARTAYQAYLAQLLTLAGEPDATARAVAIVAFETRLAQAHWTRIDSRDSVKTYNKWSRADFDSKAPGVDWSAFLAAAGLKDQTSFLVRQPSSFTGMAAAVRDTPAPVLRDYLLAQTINAYTPYLAKPFVDAGFAFNQTELSGTPQNSERWKRGTNLVKRLVGEDLGQAYVAKWFPPEAKASADQLVKNIIAAMDKRLQAIAWMAPETRTKARAKLAAFTPKIGYPDKWRDYSKLEIRRDDLVGNVMRGNAFEYARVLARLGEPIDRGEWGMTPMEINAYANFGLNEIVFPAAILQPPFFDPKADPAINYGGIGAVIGHEMSHHFDDQGSQYDATGRLSEWWTPGDVARFKALTTKLVQQYDGYEPLPGQHVQGALTLGENIADLAGLTAAYDAYKISLGGKPAPVIGGLTGDQRFYLGWAQVWRIKYREQNLRQRLLTDPHSPGEQRVATVRNLDPWYGAFQPKPGQKLYLAPEARVRIW